MPIDVISDGKRGQVVLRREQDDGTVVLLLCDEVPPNGGPSGAVVKPETPGSPTDDGESDEEQRSAGHEPGGGFFPVFGFLALTRPLELDISLMPVGVLAFRIGDFSRAAIQAIDAGATRVVLSDHVHAQSFGFRGTVGSRRPDPEGLGGGALTADA